MSIIIFVIVAPVAAAIEEAITWRVRAARMARKLPKRARQYKFT